jgi:hypothetical protein
MRLAVSVCVRYGWDGRWWLVCMMDDAGYYCYWLVYNQEYGTSSYAKF